MNHGDPAHDGPGLRIVASPLSGLDPLDVHALYKLRVDVFVAEQDCPYAEIDEVDADPGTTHLLAWTQAPDTRSGTRSGTRSDTRSDTSSHLRTETLPEARGKEELAATLRVFGTGDRDRVMHLGRVCTSTGWRSQGIAGRLIRRGLELCSDLPVEIGAQSYLEDWYESFGFARCGEDYLDGRIPHLPMRRDGTATQS